MHPQLDLELTNSRIAELQRLAQGEHLARHAKAAMKRSSARGGLIRLSPMRLTSAG
jgi:hypothetical protein